jgi:hypothetical protein
MPRPCYTEKDILNMAGKMLIACGYGTELPFVAEERRPRITTANGVTQICNPFLHSIHARRQFDALEEFFSKHFEDDPGMWMMSSSETLAALPKDATIREFGLARMRWCMLELLQSEEDEA